MSADNRPSLLNIKSMPVSTALQFTTDVLDPVVNSERFTRFELQPKGFLHPNTQLTIQVQAATKADGTKDNAISDIAFPFANVGLYSMIKRAVLKTADGTTICETDSLNDLMACKSQFVSNAANKEREQYKTGRQISYSQVFSDGKGQEAGGYGLDNHLDYDIRTATSSPSGAKPVGFKRQGLSVENHLINSHESTFSLSLHDLFPYLKSGNQLPLFMMPRVQVEIYWADEFGNGRLCSQTAVDRTLPETSFKIKSTTIFADYLFYGGEFMEEYKQKNAELQFSYIDYRLSKNSISETETGSVAQVVRNVGGNGMQVLKTFTQFGPQHNADDVKLLLGKYTALGGAAIGAKGERQKLTTNMFFNNEFLFPQSVDNPAVHFHHLISAEGAPAYISREAYSGEGNCIVAQAAHHYMSLEQRTNLQAKNFWQGHRLNNGERVDSKGIDLHTKGDLVVKTEQRVWLEILRYATLVNGQMATFYA
jgi:hypothetical protein